MVLRGILIVAVAMNIVINGANGATTEDLTTEGTGLTTEANRDTTESLTTDENTTEGLTTDENTTEGLTTDANTTEGLTIDENTTEGLTTDENTREGLTTDENTTEGLTTDENTTEGLTTDENTTEGLTTDETTTEGLTTDENTTEGLTTDENTTPGLTTDTEGTDLTTSNHETTEATYGYTTDGLTTETQDTTLGDETTEGNISITTGLTEQPTNVTTKPTMVSSTTTQATTTRGNFSFTTGSTVQPMNVTTEPTMFSSATTQATTTREVTIATDVPPLKPVKPNITVENYQGSLQFKCFFGEVVSLPYPFYEIKWYKNRVLVSTLTAATTNLQSLRLSETTLGKLGVTLTCSVRPKYSMGGNPGFSSQSDEFYVGVQLNQTSFVIRRSERPAKDIRFTLTVPFLCGTTGSNNCSLQVQMYVKSNSYGCNGEITADENSPGCRKQILSSQWDTAQTMSIRYKDRGTYYAWATFTLTLVSYSSLHPLWNNFRFAEIQVTVVDDVYIWMGKRCYSYNDPHMRTFDGRWYENQHPGEYILYEHTDLNRPMQVQVKYYNCYGGRIFCNCGVAVRAGRDVYIIDMCDGRRIMEYASCKDNILDVRRNKWNSGLYSIFFPTGTEVIVSVYYNSINVEIVASKHDVDITRGLCGRLSSSCSDDFILRNGHPSAFAGTSCYGWGLSPDDFTSSWSETNSASLFNPTYVQSLGMWTDSDKYCTCPSSESDLQSELNCSTGSVSTCDRDILYEIVGQAFCESSYNSTSLSNPEINANVPGGRKRRSIMKRSISQVVPDNATSHCEKTVGGSGAFQACSSVPNVNTNAALQICALDIELTNSTDWDSQTYETMKSNCLSELEKNTTLQETGSSGGPSVASAIRNIVCPGLPECTNHGECKNGTCICSGDYIDVDCSVQKSTPPTIIGVRGGGFCDRSEISCNTAYLVAERIASSKDLTCKIKPFTITVGGAKQRHTETIVEGKQETVVEVHCTVEQARHTVKRSTVDSMVFIEGFDISVSYDRVNFGGNSQLYIFDSACQEQNASTDISLFTLRNGTCFINSQCYMNGIINSNDVNLICNSSYPYQWTSIKGLDSTWSTSPMFIPNAIYVLLSVIAYAFVFDCVSN